MKCFKALFSSKSSLHSTSTHTVIADLVSSLVAAQNSSPLDLRAVQALITTIVELIGYCPRNEGFLPNSESPVTDTECRFIIDDVNITRAVSAEKPGNSE
jgi:hypothetical protein